MSKPISVCLRAGVELLLYCAMFGVAVTVFLFDVHHGKPGQIICSEQSLTEYAQVGLLVLSGVAFAVGGYVSHKRSLPAGLLAGMAALATVREFDWLFDRVAHGFWKVPALLVVVVAIARVWKKRKTLFTAFAYEVRLPYWGTLCSGFSLVFIFSRLFGMRRNWEAMLGEQLAKESVRSVRRLAEEGVELAGYTLIFLAAVGFLLSCLHDWRQQRQWLDTAIASSPQQSVPPTIESHS